VLLYRFEHSIPDFANFPRVEILLSTHVDAANVRFVVLPQLRDELGFHQVPPHAFLQENAAVFPQNERADASYFLLVIGVAADGARAFLRSEEALERRDAGSVERV